MKIFSFDAETNGLQGNAFAIAAVVKEEDGTIKEFLARCPVSEKLDAWVEENVMPQLNNLKETHKDLKRMLKSFAEFYLENKEDAVFIGHMVVPVESRLLIQMHQLGLIGDWDMPYNLYDLAGMLLMAGEPTDSVDSYNQKNGLEIPTFSGGTHNPLYDSYAALTAFERLLKK